MASSKTEKRTTPDKRYLDAEYETFFITNSDVLEPDSLPRKETVDFQLQDYCIPYFNHKCNLQQRKALFLDITFIDKRDLFNVKIHEHSEPVERLQVHLDIPDVVNEKHAPDEAHNTNVSALNTHIPDTDEFASANESVCDPLIYGSLPSVVDESPFTSDRFDSAKTLFDSRRRTAVIEEKEARHDLWCPQSYSSEEPNASITANETEEILERVEVKGNVELHQSDMIQELADETTEPRKSEQELLDMEVHQLIDLVDLAFPGKKYAAADDKEEERSTYCSKYKKKQKSLGSASNLNLSRTDDIVDIARLKASALPLWCNEGFPINTDAVQTIAVPSNHLQQTGQVSSTNSTSNVKKEVEKFEDKVEIELAQRGLLVNCGTQLLLIPDATATMVLHNSPQLITAMLTRQKVSNALPDSTTSYTISQVELLALLDEFCKPKKYQICDTTLPVCLVAMDCSTVGYPLPDIGAQTWTLATKCLQADQLLAWIACGSLIDCAESEEPLSPDCSDFNYIFSLKDGRFTPSTHFTPPRVSAVNKLESFHDRKSSSSRNCTSPNTCSSGDGGNGGGGRRSSEGKQSLSEQNNGDSEEQDYQQSDDESTIDRDNTAENSEDGDPNDRQDSGRSGDGPSRGPSVENGFDNIEDERGSQDEDEQQKGRKCEDSRREGFGGDREKKTKSAEPQIILTVDDTGGGDSTKLIAGGSEDVGLEANFRTDSKKSPIEWSLSSTQKELDKNQFSVHLDHREWINEVILPPVEIYMAQRPPQQQVADDDDDDNEFITAVQAVDDGYPVEEEGG